MARQSGLINLAPHAGQVATYEPASATVSTPTSAGYDPSKFTVAPEATVAKQIDSILSKDSSLLQQARRRAELKSNQAMNQRGLLHSSLAVGAGIEAADNALYERALPIAQADAQTYSTAGTNTTNAENAAKYATMQAENAARMRGAELTTNVNLANADAHNKALAAESGTANQFKQTDMETARALELADKEFQRAMGTAQLDANTRIQLANLDHQSRMELANVDRDTRIELSTIENNYRQLLQTNQDLASMYNQASTNIANIASSNLSQGAKDQATQSQLNLLKEALAAKQGVVGTPAVPGGTTPEIRALNIGQYFQATQAGRQFDQAAFDRAMREYNQKVADRDASWSRWDRAGRSGPWNVPEPQRPDREKFYL